MRPRDQLSYLEYVTKAGDTRRIYPDSLIAEQISLPATVTHHAVESGSKITDHYRPEPKVINVGLFFSGSPVRGDLDDDNIGTRSPVRLSIDTNYPKPTLFSPRGLTQAVESAFGVGPKAPAFPKSATVLQFPNAVQRLTQTLEILQQLQIDGILVTVGATVGIFPQMAITNAQLNRAPEDGDGGSITIDFEQLTFTTSDVAIALPIPTEPRAQQKKNANADGENTVPEGAKKTVLKSLVDAI